MQTLRNRKISAYSESLEPPINLLSASAPVLLCFGFRTILARLAVMVENSLRNLQPRVLLKTAKRYAMNPTSIRDHTEGASPPRPARTRGQIAKEYIRNMWPERRDDRHRGYIMLSYMWLLIALVLHFLDFIMLAIRYVADSAHIIAPNISASTVGFVAIGTLAIASGTLSGYNTSASRSNSQSGPATAVAGPSIIGIHHPTYFIMLCLRVRKHLTLRHDISVGEMTRDRELFAAFRGRYYTRLGSIRRMWSLYTVQRINFVKVSHLRVLVYVHSQSLVRASVVQRDRRYRNWHASSRRDTLCIRP